MVGDRIREIRSHKNLTINELAQLSQISKSYISSIERGVQKNPSINALKKLAETLDVPLESIISLDTIDIMIDEEWLIALEEAIQQGLTKEEFHYILSFLNTIKMKREKE